MVTFMASLILPYTVNFYPPDDPVSLSNGNPGPKKHNKEGKQQSHPQPQPQPQSEEEDYTTYKTQNQTQTQTPTPVFSHSQSLHMSPMSCQLPIGRAPAAIAKTPGATTNVENIFRPQEYRFTLPPSVLVRDQSAANRQALMAAESQNKVWGNLEDPNQPKSLAQSPPSQSIFDDGVTIKDPNTNRPETSTTVAKPKITRRRKKEMVYATDNYTIQPTTLGNAGLFAAVNAVADKDIDLEHFWVGTLGMPTDSLPQLVKTNIADKMESDYGTFVVYINDTDMNSHYENYCKNILWPMLHSQVPDVPKSKAYQDNSWKHYVTVNRSFADCINKNYKTGDVVWVHDYHLLLLPSMVREAHPDAQIGLYVHSAFPPAEIFRNLPSRLELIAGMLGSNMIGFQTDDYRYQFLQTCSRLLNIEATGHGLVLDNGRFIDVFPVPMGIDIASMNIRRNLPEVKDRMKELSERFAGKYVIFARDKLDGIHGLKHKLRAFADFLDRYPEWERKVVLVQIATSTIQDVELRDTVNNLITEINSDWGDLNYQPIVYLNQDIDYTQYLALLSIADCMLVTSVSEGMNLTCHEYVVCQDATSSLKGYGPLVVSEFIGAAKVFGDNALLINPWHAKGVAEALDRALKMKPKERKERWENMYALTDKFCARNWHQTFTANLAHAWKEHEARQPSHVPRLQVRELLNKYRHAQNRLLVLDFEGTLTTWDCPREEVVTVPLRVIDVLSDLVEDPNNHVYVMSQQSVDGLEHMFRLVPKIGLIAENGAFLRRAGGQEWTQLVDVDTTSWRKGILDVLQHHKTSIPGSTIREFKSGITFSYADSEDPKDASSKAGALANQINEMCENLGVSATPFGKNLHINPMNINKALATKLVEQDLFHTEGTVKPDFVFAIGDTYEDECVFRWAHELRGQVADENVVTCVVGVRSTGASASLSQGTAGVLSTLEKLVMSTNAQAA